MVYISSADGSDPSSQGAIMVYRHVTCALGIMVLV
jgi:hypothetical protein